MSCQPATQCIVLMVVAMNGHWKLPIGYFPVASMNAETQARLITEALILLWDIGVTIVSLTGRPEIPLKCKSIQVMNKR